MTGQDISGLLLIEKVLLLKSLSIFSDTPETILAEMAYLLKEVEYAESTPIVKEGETGNCMYIIFRGEVRITKGKELLATLKEKRATIHREFIKSFTFSEDKVLKNTAEFIISETY